MSQHYSDHIQPALTAPTLAVLELAAQTESLLNLYMQAKRELHMATGITGMDVTKFPVVESVRAQVNAVRKSVSGKTLKQFIARTQPRPILWKSPKKS